MKLRVWMLGLALVAQTSAAQALPVQVSSQTYVPLSGATAVTFTMRGSNMTDEGYAELMLPFAFPWFGMSYSSVFIDVNGFLALGGACSPGSFSSICYSNTSFPTAATPNGVIAGVWDDMELGPNTTVRTKVSASEATVEWVNLARYSSTSTVTFQITLNSSGTVVVHYGPISDVANAFTFSAGLEDVLGTQGQNLFSGCTTSCTGANYVVDQVFTIGEPNEADLVASAVSLANLTRLTDGNLTFDVNATLRNVGRTAASGVSWRAWLSLDRVLDGADVQVAQGGPVNLPATSSQVVTGAAATSSPPGTGEYYVLVEVDSTNAVMEASETNNVGSTATSLVQGVDLVASSVAPPTGIGAGLTSSYGISFSNRGATDAGVTDFRLYLSLDQALDPADVPLFSGTRPVAAGQTVSETVSVVAPTTVPAGQFYVLLQVDPANAIVEANEANNVVSSAGRVLVSRPDLVSTGLELRDPATGAVLTRAALGQSVRAQFQVSNPGIVDARNFYVALVLSADRSFSLLADTWVCDQLVPLVVAGGTPVAVTLDCTLPLVDGAGAALANGDYHLLALADATGAIAETNEANNGAAIGPVRLAAPGPDLVVASLLAPANAGAGEAVPVERVLRNVGSGAAPATGYHYVVSRDAEVSADDERLVLLPGGSAATPGTVTLASGAADSAVDLVRLPASLAPGPWFIGCVLDAAGALTEMNEDNNTRTAGPVAVVIAGLFVAGDQLPDAVVGRPYAFRLGAQGAQAALTWSPVMGEGELSAGLQLAADGLVSGTPSAVGVSAFTVRVTDGVTTTNARLALRVTQPLTPLELVTVALPPAVAGSGAYSTTLAATGGQLPYAWRLVSGELPAWLTLSPGGVLAGTVPPTLTAATLRLTVEVEDAARARAQRELVLSLRPTGSFELRTAWLAEAVVGQPWSQAVEVANGDGSPPVTPLRFTLAGSLPAGLTFTSTADGASFQGTPGAAGEFALELAAEDALGRADVARYVLRVHPARTAVVAPGLPARVAPGGEVAFQLAVGTQREASYRLVAGSLPPGVELSASGAVAGRLAADEPTGRWDFVVEATDVSGVGGLGAFTLLVEPVPAGCSAGAGLLGPAGLLVLLGLGLRRRRHAVAVAAALGLTASGAFAQGTGYTASAPAPAAYVPLAGAVPVMPNTSLTLPFPVVLGGTSYSQVALSQYGYLAFGASSSTYSTNQNVPYTGTSTLVPRTYVAPWWDVLTQATIYRMAVTGQAPNRVVAFEWDGAGANSTASRISFQADLTERTGRIRFRYSSALPGTTSASVGVQFEYGVGTPGLACASTASCTATAYPAGQVIELTRAPDLVISELSAPGVLYAGARVPLSARVSNGGGRDVSNAVVRFYFSTDAVLDAGDVVMGSTLGASVVAMGEAVASTIGTVPAGASVGAGWVFARVDPDDFVLEAVETNNAALPLSVSVAPPAPDLVVSSVQAPASAAPGASLQLTRVIENQGSAPMGAARYTWFLSANEAVGVGDRPLGAAKTVAALATGGSDTATESVTIPSDVAAGRYWLGVCVNYDPAATPSFGAAEMSLLNNCTAASAATAVSGGALSVTTTSLPVATARVPYGAWLAASGGSGAYAWSLASGTTLPRGLELTAAGALRGTPVEPGRFMVAVEVASGGATQAAALELEVRDEQPFVVLEQELSPARVGEAYLAVLPVSGGRAPYQWSLAAGVQLPAGLSLAADGALSGRPASAGTFPFGVEVRDATGAMASGSLLLTVSGSSSLHFVPASLPGAVLRQPWSTALEVAGGVPPYTVLLSRFQELPLDATDVPGAELLALPEELGLALESDRAATRLAGTPLRAGRFGLRFEVQDAARRSASVEYELLVTAPEPLVITTAALPEGEAGAEYSVKLEASQAGVEFSLPCVRHAESASSYACVPAGPLGQLPANLQLGSDGSLTGTLVDAGAKEPVTHTFLVKATAADGQRVVKALSLTVRPKASGGCSTTGLGAWVSAALALVWRRRRAARV